MKVELSAARMSQAIYSRSLVYFAAVAETGSVREASRQLNVAASAVSRQLNHLQERLGVRLFDNLGHSLRLAPAGKELLRYHRFMTENLDATVDAISALHGHRTGTVRIATVDSFATALLAQMMSEFAALYPSIHLSLSIHSATEVAAQIADGLADVGFTFNLRSRDVLDVVVKADCPMGIVVAEGHPLAGRAIVTYEECVAYPIGLLKPGSSIRAALERASTLAAMPWPRYVEATSMRFLEDLAREGNHVTFQPQYRFMTDRRQRGLVFVPIDDVHKDSDEFVMIVDRRLNLRPASREFLDFARDFLLSRIGQTGQG